MIGGLLALIMSAWAGFSVEGPAFGTRSEASVYAKAGRAAGHKGRIVRRFREGAGWEFVVRFEDLANLETARKAAADLVTASSSPVTLLDEEGKVVDQTATVPEDQKPEAEDAEASTDPASEEPPWFEAAAEAHGPGLDALSGADRVKFVYTRKLPDGRIARHTYARRGTDLYLGIEGIEGEVVNTTTLALGDAAWLSTPTESSGQDLQRTRETIQKFGPAGIIPIVLDLEAEVDNHPVLASLKRHEEPEKLRGEMVWLFTPQGAQTPLVGLGVKDQRIRQLALDQGNRVHEFSKYTEVDGVWFPQRILSRRDGAQEADQVIVETVELDGDLPEAWFTAPK